MSVGIKKLNWNIIQKILTWYASHGRLNLPWSGIPKDPYKIWVSEIMLQQTQVQTVIPYFERFITRFPNIEILAHASQDQVLQYWAGLGYYARGRNLHRAAQIIYHDYQNIFPDQLDKILELPGIGRSTAGAIYSFAFNQPAAILDGNVKRVLVRILGISEWPELPAVKNQLWTQADAAVFALKKHAPHRASDYTQAMMDLGALICTPKKPLCVECPAQSDCWAFQNNRVSEIPAKRPKNKLMRPSRLRLTRQFFVLHWGDKVLVYQRPQKSVWGGLWSLPHENLESKQDDLKVFLRKQNISDNQISNISYLTSFEHVFTHFILNLEPIYIRLNPSGSFTLNSHSERTLAWANIQSLITRDWALPKPIQQIVETVVNQL